MGREKFMKTVKLKVEFELDKLPKEIYQAILNEIMEEIDIYLKTNGELVPMVEWDAEERIPSKRQQNLKSIIQEEAKLNPESIDKYLKLFKEYVKILEKKKKGS